MGEQVAARSNGDVAQLGEHLPCKQGVESSNLFISTGLRKKTEHCTLKTAYTKHLKYVKRRDRDETRRCESSGQVEKPRNNKPSDINAIVSEEAKQERAQGGCLGTKSR